MKKIILLLFLLVAIGAKAQTHYFTVKVSLAFKNKLVLNRMSIDVGTDPQHPLNQKVHNTDGGVISVTQPDGKDLSLSSEVDLLNYFENHGWDLVSVNEVMIIQDKYLQYLFKSE